MLPPRKSKPELGCCLICLDVKIASAVSCDAVSRFDFMEPSPPRAIQLKSLPAGSYALCAMQCWAFCRKCCCRRKLPIALNGLRKDEHFQCQEVAAAVLELELLGDGLALELEAFDRNANLVDVGER